MTAAERVVAYMGKTLPPRIVLRKTPRTEWMFSGIMLLMVLLTWFLLGLEFPFLLPFRLPQSMSARPGGARLTRGEAIKIAEAEMARLGEPLYRHEKPIADYNVSSGDAVWSVLFIHKDWPHIGDFVIRVDDKTGKAKPLSIR